MMQNLPELLLLLAGALALVYAAFFLPAPPNRLRSVMKTLPVGILAVAALLGGLPIIVAAALAVCAAGDWFLSLEGEDRFLSGLKAFLGGHLLYIAHFASGVPGERYLTTDMGFLALILAALIVSVLARIWPYLDTLKGPVALYSIIIAGMAFVARAADSGQIVLAGIALFVVSDIILAQDKFTPLTRSMARRLVPWLIWVFYFAGQALIVYGMFVVR